MLSQFSKEIERHITLADLDFNFPKDVYPIGRLDADSEGLLLLSSDSSLNKKILDPEAKLKKTYWVQVEGIPTELDLDKLRGGIKIKLKNKSHLTEPAQLMMHAHEPNLPERVPPIRVRKQIPVTWVEIKISEGKNRQVRKMFAGIGFPVLRLVRVGIAGLFLGNPPIEQLGPGDVIKINSGLL